jgi:serine/threonine-protein phosphatase Stp1
MTPVWHSAARTETGKVRVRNEDAILNFPERGLWAVADGMGGHQNGALASRLIVESLAELPCAGSLEDRVKQLRHCLHQLNLRLGRDLTLLRDRPDPVVGSTVVALLAVGDRAACVWAGDSRCYLWRHKHLYQLSRDHSLAQQMIDEQRLTAEQAACHPSAHALTRAIGANEELVLDILQFELLPGDVLLLCSDGLYQGHTADSLGAALDFSTPAQALTRLFNQVLSGPARDNLSAVVIKS